MGRRLFARCILSVVMLLPLATHASDGQIEINQTRALAGGITPSDGPGFPITIDAPGSYLLTSALSLVVAGDDAIEISTDDVTIDLNGFTIGSVSTCSIGSCSIGTGDGIAKTGIGVANHVTVRNGRIRGFGGNCIWLERGAHVHDVLVQECGASGIQVTFESIVMNNRVRNIGRWGLDLDDQTLYAYNNITATDLGGSIGGDVTGGEDGGGNYCASPTCKPIAIPRRHYYLTTTLRAGNQVVDACMAGSHAASLVELSDPSHLFYNTSEGQTRQDSGAGPPHGVAGWIRTGNDHETSGALGANNCNSYTSSSSSHRGTTAELSTSWTSVPPWAFSTILCDQTLPVWCVED